VIVIVLRHADRGPDPVDDLTVAGQERAKLLATMLADSKVSVAYRSEFVRAHRTLEPLERRLGSALAVKELSLGNMAADAHARKMVKAIKSQSSYATIVVVGHSDTVGPIVEGLGGGPVGPIRPDEFDKLFVLFIDPSSSRVTLLKLRYGATT
jgi:phosphohistidine phosphatase SixA